jgi:hypothetical protein
VKKYLFFLVIPLEKNSPCVTIIHTVSGRSAIDLTNPAKYVPSFITDFFAGKNTQTFLPISIGLFCAVAFLLPSRVRIVPIPEIIAMNGKEIINADVDIRKITPDFSIVKAKSTT